MSAVNVVVTCSKDKRFSVVPECQLRNSPGCTLSDRLREWQSRTIRHWEERVSVAELYAGDHWSQVRAFNSSVFEIEIWVCSAGFGLIRYDDAVVPYGATFSTTHPDSVAAHLPQDVRASAPAEWWSATEDRWRKQFGHRPRSLAALMAEYPDRPLLVVASESYMRAIMNDLKRGVSQLNDPDLLSIVSSGIRSIDGLDANLVPCDARLQALMGGARRSLNTRLAATILRDSRRPPRASELSRKYGRLLEEQPPLEKFDRQPMSDDDIKAFIRTKLRSNSSLRHTPLLRMLRDSDKACEQKRFAMLYREVVEGIDG